MSIENEQSMIKTVKAELARFTLETSSWALADSGTRFGVFKCKGIARDIFEKIDDAAFVHKLTGIAPAISVHVTKDIDKKNAVEVANYAKSQGIRIGTVNPDLFVYDMYKHGSLANPDKGIRERAVNELINCVEVMDICDVHSLNIWLADGTNYPGQDDLRTRKYRIFDGLQKVYNAMGDSKKMLIEYKLFEPAFYSTDIPDWGTAYVAAKHCGPKAKVLVDIGHHPLGTNIEQIVSFLLDEDMLGGLHLNSKKYADDDLTTGSMNPYELFLVFCELVKSGDKKSCPKLQYVIDQCHNVKPKIEAMIQSIVNAQELYCKALLVDYKTLEKAQKSGDVVKAEEILRKAFFKDIVPLLTAFRKENSVPSDPLQAYRDSGYQEKIESERAC